MEESLTVTIQTEEELIRNKYYDKYRCWKLVIEGCKKAIYLKIICVNFFSFHIV